MNNIFQLEQLTHLALAQYHRWYQVYEVPFTDRRIANQKDILSDDVEIRSQMGTSKGKEGLEDRLRVFTGWQNAHHMEKSEVKLLPDGSLSLEADILYQNIRPDDTKLSYRLHYSTLLMQRENDLPIFTLLDLRPIAEVKEFVFEPAYGENRVKSFLHYWLYLMERPVIEKFRELLAPGFTLDMSSGQVISDESAFAAWIDSVRSRIATSTHSYENLKIAELADGNFGVSVDFNWKGITVAGAKMTAKTHHEWVLANNMEERFARMKTMKVTAIKPFSVVEDF